MREQTGEVMSFKKPLLSIAIAMIIVLSAVSSTRAEAMPSVEITRVDYPAQVSAGQSFTVNVTIRYSYGGWTLADLGIFQENFTKIFDYVRYYMTGEAVRSFTLQVVAPDTSTDLELLVATRYWYQNFWLNDTKTSQWFNVKVVGSSEPQSPDIQPSIVKLDGNEWYYWDNHESGACLIWLSGGHAYADHVTMNPYELETFGAMKYINDLSKRFSVLALRRGNEGHTVPFTTQAYYALGYYLESSFLKGIHNWILENGHNFTYMIGYSTGGIAAGYEVAVRDPETWMAPNGAIVISGMLGGIPPNNLFESISHATDVKSNTLLLYGEVWSEELWPQGKEFYDSAPQKTATPWYLKEWHLFPDSSHEVWVEEKDGAHYNSAAYNLTTDFIEKCKSPWHRLSEWNDGSIEFYDITSGSVTGEQRPKTSGTVITTKVGNTVKVKVWLYNCSSLDICSRATIDYIKVDLYSSEGYIDTRYTNRDGYEEFVFQPPSDWENKTVKLFTTLGGEYRGIYTPTVDLTVIP